MLVNGIKSSILNEKCKILDENNLSNNAKDFVDELDQLNSNQ